MLKIIRVWDNKGETADRYTVAIQETNGWDIYGMSSDPSSPQGFNQYSHTDDKGEMGHCGERVHIFHLPKEVQIAIRRRAYGE